MRVDVYYRILVDAKVPCGILKPSLKRQYWSGTTDVDCLKEGVLKGF